MIRLATLAVLLGLAVPAGAESILERRYTSAKLDGFWTATLGAAAPDLAAFEALAPGGDAPPPVADAPAPDFGLPFAGEVLGESGGPRGTVVRRAFPVIPFSPEDAAVLYPRLAWAEIYLARYRFYEAVSTDDAATLAALTERQYAAAAEAYLTLARQYYAGADLPAKCAHLTRLNELSAGPLGGITEALLPEGWRALLPIVAATEARLGSETLANLVCSVAPVRGRAETVDLVETRVRERIMTEVRAKVDDTLALLEASAIAFQTLVDDMDVPIRSAEILELERVLGNASANMVLVKEDQLRAAETIATLKATDLGSLNQPGQLQEFTDGRERMAAMVAGIEVVMSALADFSAIVEDPAIRAELGPCETLRGAYSALDLGEDTGTLTLAISGPYEDCLARASAVVARFQEPSLDKAVMAALAAEVRLISETYLSTVAP